jgi:SAM-dependent methyltransferase
MMSQREFDQYSESYTDLLKDPIRDRFAGSHPEFFHVRKAHLILDYFRRKQLDTSKMRYLDVGCGQGDLLRILRPSFADVAGCDPSSRMIASLEDINVQLQVDESKLPFPDECVDFVTASGVFHHVPPENRTALAKEVHRLLKPEGVFAIIEHNPVNPVTRLIVSRTPIDTGAILLKASEARKLFLSASLSVDEQCYFLYMPKHLYENGGRPIENLLAKIPLGGQYALFGVKRGPPRG